MFAFSSWTTALTARGFGVLRPSHHVPVSLWLRESVAGGDRVLHFSARGTTLRLAVYAPSDLTTLLLRAECDCAEHRTAGAASRSTLNPGAVATFERMFDGARTLGWRGHEAATLPLIETAGIFEALYASLPVATGRPGSVTHPLQEPAYSAASTPMLARASTS